MEDAAVAGEAAAVAEWAVVAAAATAGRPGAGTPDVEPWCRIED